LPWDSGTHSRCVSAGATSLRATAAAIIWVALLIALKWLAHSLTS
jgi:hypothetical protein